ncbi:SDR family NAD(P)-dependent oxidoreductase [Streptomyces fumanus]|uniref:SDR family NAD(P)-dependent oxidoreductase n=1 Tax=Streptomyces fumanus TaxID=67302 RepID=UPI0034018504
MPKYPLAGRTVLVTGAAGGIGSACAHALRARGANLALLGRDLASLTALARTLGEDRALPLGADVTDRTAVEEAVARTVDRFGGLDVVFANAGVAPTRPATIATTEEADFERIIEVNLMGTWRTVRAALPHVVSGRGHILVNCSVYAYLNGAANAAYAASKAAVEQLVRALRVEWGRCGATAGVLYPGWVETGLSRVAFGGDRLATRMRETAFPALLAGAVRPEAVADRVVDGIERRAAGITVPRRWQPVGVLRGVINPLVDRRLIRDTRLQSLLRALEGAGPAEDAPTHDVTPAAGRSPGPSAAVSRP